MAKIVFWSPIESAVGSTHAIIASATLMGIAHKAKCILMHANRDSKKIESSYTPYEQLLESGILSSAETGVGALIKIIVSNKLSASTIKNYAKPVLKEGRLDILYGNVSNEEDQYQQILSNFSVIARRADEIYDLVFIDSPKGSNKQELQSLLSAADVVVCVINQDSTKLQSFFEKVEKEQAIKDKTKIYVMADYDEKSKYNVHNIRRKYGVKDQIVTVPHNVYYSDACNEGRLIDFIYSNINADSSDYIGNFITSVNELVERIIAESKIKDF